MQTVREGDRVRVHYAIYFQDGSKVLSRGRRPLELTAGVEHPCLPMLGGNLTGMAPGSVRWVTVPHEWAYGLPDPNRLRRVSNDRFPGGAPPEAGRWLVLAGAPRRSCILRVLEVRDLHALVALCPLCGGKAVAVAVKVVGITCREGEAADIPSRGVSPGPGSRSPPGPGAGR